MAEKSKPVTVHLTLDQHSLFRRKLFVEGHSYSKVMRALVNAYIMGDISVTSDGHYYMAPPTHLNPIVEVEKEHDVVEIEPEWGTTRGRPQIGQTNATRVMRQKNRWGTRELAAYLRQATGRKVSQHYLRRMLDLIEIPKASNGRWQFSGPDDPHVQAAKDAIDKGIYQAIIKEGIRVAERYAAAREEKVDELKDAIAVTKNKRRQEYQDSLDELLD